MNWAIFLPLTLVSYYSKNIMLPEMINDKIKRNSKLYQINAGGGR
jgi:hypothetical protein